MSETECRACDGEGYLVVVDPDERMPVKKACGECRGVGKVCEFCLGSSDQHHPCSECGVGVGEIYTKPEGLSMNIHEGQPPESWPANLCPDCSGHGTLAPDETSEAVIQCGRCDGSGIAQREC